MKKINVTKKALVFMLGILASSNAISQYCTVSTTNAGDYLSAISTVGASQNVTYSATTQPAGSYADETTQQIYSYPAGSFDVNTTYVGGSNGVNVWVDWNNDSDFDDAGENLFYQADGNATKTGTILVPTAQTLGNYRMRVRAQFGATANPPSCGSVAYGSTVDFTLVVSTPPSCISPTSLSATNQTASSVDLSWTENGSATAWFVEYGPIGFAPGSNNGTSISAGTNNSFLLNSLASSTNYDIYVRSYCGVGDTSFYNGPVVVTTLCTSFTAPWIDNFTTAVTPICWSQSANGGGPWEFTGSPDYDVANVTDHTNGDVNNFAWVDYSNAVASVIIETPVIDVSALTVPELSFWTVSHFLGTLNPYNTIFIEAYNGTSWVLIDQISGETGPNWIENNYVLTSFVYNTNLVRVRFRAETGGAATNFNNDLLLDDVAIQEAPTCPKPSNLTFISSTSTSVDLSWTENGSAPSWFVEYGAPGFTPGTGTEIPAPNNNPFNLTGLTPNTEYDVFVRSFCGVGDTSLYSSQPLLINTYDLASFTFMETSNECPDAGYIDIKLTGTAYDIADDGVQGITLPFPMILQGLLITEMTIGNNGGIELGTLTGAVGYGGDMTTLNNSIYPWGDDLDSETGDIYYEVQGNVPNRKIIVQWETICNWSGSIGAPTVTFQIQIDEATQEIFFIYDDVLFGGVSVLDDYAANADIGLAGPNQDFNISNNDPQYLMDNSCVRFYYPSCPKPSEITSTYSATDSLEIGWTANGTETSWIIEYGPTGFTPGLGTMVPANSNPDTLGNLVDNTIYDIYVYADCGSTDTSNFGGPGTFVTDIVCPAPTNFQFYYTSNDTVAYSWSPGGTETSWNIEYGETGFIPGTSTGTATTVSTIVDSTLSLTPGTVYEFYIQSDCGLGQNNPWTGPLTYATPIVNDSSCDAVSVLVDGSTTTFSNLNATTQTNTPITGFNTVWFSFVAPGSGHVEIKTCGSDFNNFLEVYESTDCSDFGTFTLVDGATGNPFAICSGIDPAGINLCGLTPDDVYYLAIGSQTDGSTGIFPLTLTELPAINAGTAVPVDVCEDNATFDLFTIITGNLTNTGQWYSPVANAANELTSSLSVVGFPAGTYTYDYVHTEICDSDTVSSSITVIPLPNMGIGGAIDAGCNYGPVSLSDGLSGTIDLGGTWYDEDGTELPGSLIVYDMEPAGSYDYFYVLDNGVCDADSSVVTVTIEDCTGFEENPVVLSIYPNPVNVNLTINLINVDPNAKAELYTIQGSLVLAPTTNTNSKIELNMSNIASGIYILKVTANSFTQELRVVKN